MLAWSVLTSQPIAAHEARLLIEIDNIYTYEKAKKQAAENKRKGK